VVVLVVVLVVDVVDTSDGDALASVADDRINGKPMIIDNTQNTMTTFIGPGKLPSIRFMRNPP
jgi:hypothetical protein